jgi:hypothetical protein
MPRNPNVKMLPERDRRETLAKFLEVLDSHPDLGHFRAAVPAGPERQLALFAALERAALRGGVATAPPAADDPADQLLCDLLEVIDGTPALARLGAYYGADRHRVNLQALGAWSGQPMAVELFTTAFTHLTPAAVTVCPASTLNYSPAPQDTGPDGDLIGPGNAESPANSGISAGIIHHAAQTPGEKVGPPGPGGPDVPPQSLLATPIPDGVRDLPFSARPLRRGRPPVVDDLAQGRLLGLIAVVPPGGRPTRRASRDGPQPAEAGRGVRPASCRGPPRRHFAAASGGRQSVPHQLAGRRLAGQLPRSASHQRLRNDARRARARAEAKLVFCHRAILGCRTKPCFVRGRLFFRDEARLRPTNPHSFV